jgi:flagellar basal body P-ring formation protein FlgA
VIKQFAASLALAAILFAAAPAPAAPTLIPAVTVTGPVIRLGDLFTDTGGAAAQPVAPAPLPGTRVTYSSDWLAALARARHIDWAPGSGYDQIVVERASRAIGADEIGAQIQREITQRQPGEDTELRLDNPGVRLVVPADAPDTISVEGLAIEGHSGRISAIVSAPAGDPAAQHLRVSGRLIYRIEVPVLARPVAQGTPIAAGDLDLVKLRRDGIAQDIATDLAQLIGKSPRRPLRAGEPVHLSDVQLPILIHKGDLVIIVLETPTLRLTGQGQALEDGAFGKSIRVSNTKSSRVIDTMIVAPGTVTVAGFGTADAIAAR